VGELTDQQIATTSRETLCKIVSQKLPMEVSEQKKFNGDKTI
jgi:hypothetical protein